MMKKLNKNLSLDKLTVEAMSCKMSCNCKCTSCTTTSDYAGHIAIYTSNRDTLDFDLEWTIQALA